MVFTEDLRKEVRDKAFFRCCRCQNIGVEVHHILPQKNGGADTIDNAAPLCPTCHADFGDNPEKRKIITEMRDSWYRRVKEIFQPSDLRALGEIATKLINIQNDTSKIGDLRQSVKEFMDGKLQEITVDNATLAVSSIIGSASVILHAGPLMRLRNSAYWIEGDREPYCSRCWEVENKKVHLHPLGNPAMYNCPNCKCGPIKARPELDSPPRASVFYPSRQNPGR
jgi:hypothetical protein